MKRIALLSLFLTVGLLGMQSDASHEMDDIHWLALSVKRLALLQENNMELITCLQQQHYQLEQDYQHLVQDHILLLNLFAQSGKSKKMRRKIKRKAKQD